MSDLRLVYQMVDEMAEKLVKQKVKAMVGYLDLLWVHKKVEMMVVSMVDWMDVDLVEMLDLS